MKITILGTGTSVGIPMIGCSCYVCQSEDTRDKRLRTSINILTKNTSLQIDIGPDFRQQVLRSQITRIDAILLTHHHADHTSGLDEIRAFNFSQDQLIPIYAENYVLEDLKLRFDYIFGGVNYPGLPNLKLQLVEPGNSVNISGIDVLPVRIMHGELPILGYRIGNFAYITDANFIDEVTLSQLQDLDILIINALRQKLHHSHFSLQQSLEMIKVINAKKSYITHISHQMGTHQETELKLPTNVSLAFDGLILEVNE